MKQQINHRYNVLCIYLIISWKSKYSQTFPPFTIHNCLPFQKLINWFFIENTTILHDTHAHSQAYTVSAPSVQSPNPWPLQHGHSVHQQCVQIRNWHTRQCSEIGRMRSRLFPWLVPKMFGKCRERKCSWWW